LRSTFKETGNIFVDTGLAVLCTMANKQSPEELTKEDVKDAIKLLEILVNKDEWRRDLRKIFTQLYKPIHPSLKNDHARGLEVYSKWLNELYDSIYNSDKISIDNICNVCGEPAITRAYRFIFPLIGAGKFLNFFSFFERGLPICGKCLLAVQFLPLGIAKFGGRFVAISAPWEIRLRFVDMVYKQFNMQFLGKMYTVAEFRSIEQTIYDFLREYNDEMDNIHFYRFINMGTGQSIDEYLIGSKVSRFLNRIYDMGYVVEQEWRKAVETILADKKKRDLFGRMCGGYSIVNYFIVRKKGIIGTWKIIETYQQEIRGMEREQLDKIIEIAEKIFEYGKMKGNVPKVIREFEGVRNISGFRTKLTRAHEYLSKHGSGGLMDLLDLKKYILDEKGWKEIRDLIVYKLYELNGV